MRRPAIFALIFTSFLTLSGQQWRAVTPHEAESHLLKKVEPVYPPFARVAGIEGTMSAADSVVAGFANLGGEWGQLYCGAGENDHLDIEQCR